MPLSILNMVSWPVGSSFSESMKRLGRTRAPDEEHPWDGRVRRQVPPSPARPQSSNSLSDVLESRNSARGGEMVRHRRF
jgi:hypothetical protein